MKRKIIKIDEDRCDGCGECVTACAEGALQIIDGKARLVKEDFCDGLGACIGDCPTGALKIEEREGADYDPAATRAHVAARGDAEALRRFDEAAAAHETAAPNPVPPPAPASPAMPFGGGCPGLRVRDDAGAGLPPKGNPSELRQWPIQLHLVPPGAPFFRNKELVIMSTCGPLASADVHGRFLRGRAVVVACPKLDRTEPYAAKLAAIFSDPSIPKAIVVRMEVPCCGGLTRIVADAARASGRSDLAVEEVTLSLDGEVRSAASSRQ